MRYRLLETVRQYVGERLDAGGEAAALHARHLDWCLALAQGDAIGYMGPREPAWLDRLEQEHDNLRAALGWALAQRQEGQQAQADQRPAEAARLASTALQLARELPRFWRLRGYLSEGRRWLDRALAAAGDAPAAERARALLGAGKLAYAQGDPAAARAHLARALALFRELGDALGAAETQRNLGGAAVRQGDYVAAQDFLEASLAGYEALGHRAGISGVLFVLGSLAYKRGDYAAAGARYVASLARCRELGYTYGIANAAAELGSVLTEQGADGPQASLLAEALALYRHIGERSAVATVLGTLALHAWARAEHERALTLLAEGLALDRQVENRRGTARLLGIEALVALSRCDHAGAERLCRESLALHRAAGETWEIGRYGWVLAAAAFGQGQPERAARLFAAASAVRERVGAPLPPIFQSTHDGALAAVRRTLGEDAFAATWAAGQALSLEESLAPALAPAAPT